MVIERNGLNNIFVILLFLFSELLVKSSKVPNVISNCKTQAVRDHIYYKCRFWRNLTEYLHLLSNVKYQKFSISKNNLNNC